MIAQPDHRIAHIDPTDIHTHTGSTRGSTGRHDAAAVWSHHGTLHWRASAHAHGREPVLRPSTHRRRGRRDAHDANKKSAADAASAATVSPQRAERPSSLPAVLAVLVVVDAIDLPDSGGAVVPPRFFGHHMAQNRSPVISHEKCSLSEISWK